MELVNGNKYSDLTRRIVGAAMAVHNGLGPGHAEEVYQKALELEFEAQGIGFESQRPVTICYRGADVGLRFLDFVVEEKVIVEIKTVPRLGSVHEWQVIAYFAATEYEVALLINFGQAKLQWKRLLPPKKILEKRHGPATD
jgi:GxxExxY protein